MRRAATYLAAAALAIAALAAFAPAALATTFVVSPTGSGSTCTEASPCALGEGLSKAYVGVGNEVLLLDGTYTPATGVEVTHPIRFGGKPGGSATLTLGKNELYVGTNSGATIHDLRINTTGGFLLQSGSAERVFVQYRGEGTSACDLSVDPGATVTMTDSVCWSHKGPVSNGMFAQMVSPGAGTFVLRNDTLISDGASGQGIYIDSENYGNASASTNLTVAGTNVIASGGQEDILLTTQGKPGYPHTATGLFTHSNYAKLSNDPGFTTATEPGTEGNQTAPPLFVNAPEGDFHELPGSPTLLAGLTDPANGALALGGEPRTGPTACDGSPGPTDIGAYQAAALEPLCPSPPSDGGGNSSDDHGTPPPPPGPTLDKTAPQTKFTKKTATKLFFTSSEPGSTFRCKLDKGKWKPCHSPYKISALAPGRHTLKVEATDAAGNTDATPAKRTFRIPRPHRAGRAPA
jgi:hypothetical protein